MARKRKKTKQRGGILFRSSWKFLTRSNLTPKQKRIKRRRAHKFRRSSNYWTMLSNTMLYKIDMRETERLWLEVNAPGIEPILIDMPDVEHIPSYRKGIWDGKAYVVEFDDAITARRFKHFVWNLKV